MPVSFDKNDFFDGNVKPSAVLRIFQDVAVAHANILGVGFDDMLKKNLLWVVLRIKYKVLSCPFQNEPLTVTTNPSAKTMLDFDRDFEVKNTSGKVLIQGTSKWCFIDSRTRRLAKLQIFDCLTHFDREPLFADKFLKSPTFEPTQSENFVYEVKKKDIDSNGHMNNKVYAKLVEKLLSQEQFDISFFQINYVKEAMFGDKISVFKKANQDSFLVLGKLQGGEVSFFAELKSRKNCQ